MDNFSKDISGFYYDQQLSSRELSVTLHANRVPEKDDKGNFIRNEEGAIKWKDPDNPEEQISGGDYPDGTKFFYNKTPIISSIINEDFSVDIANNWSDAGGDPLSEFWNNYRKSGPYMQKIIDFAADISKKTENWLKRETGKDSENKVSSDGKSWGKAAVEGIGWLANQAKKGSGMNSDYLRRVLVTKGTRFVYYGGTGINIGNLGMKFTIFPTYENGAFKTVNQQLNGLMPYITGDFIPIKASTGSNTANEFIQDYFSWQLPPGDFEPDIKDVDIVQKGTLKLKFGSYYFLDNLVISGCQISMSRQLIKNPTVNDGVLTPGSYQQYTPLFCDVSLTFKPASKYSMQSLKRFIQGSQYHKDYVKEANDSLKKHKDNEISQYVGNISDY